MFGRIINALRVLMGMPTDAEMELQSRLELLEMRYRSTTLWLDAERAARRVEAWMASARLSQPLRRSNPNHPTQYTGIEPEDL